MHGFSFQKKRSFWKNSSNYLGRYRRSLTQKRTPIRSKRGQTLITMSLRKSRENPIIKYVVVGIVVVLIGWSGYFVFISDYFLIKKITTEINKDDSLKETINLASITKPYYKTNLLFLETENLHQKVLKNFPQIWSLKIKKIPPNQLTIKIKTSEVAANLINKISNREKKFQLLANGYIINEGSEDPALPFIIIRSETSFQSLTQIITEEKLKYIIESMKGFNRKFNMRVLDSEYDQVSRELHMRAEKNFMVWLDMQQPWEIQLDKLKRALTKLDIYNLPLKYIDLRIASANGDKIYYMERK